MYHGREEEEKEKNKNLFAKRRPKDYQFFFLGEEIMGDLFNVRVISSDITPLLSLNPPIFD